MRNMFRLLELQLKFLPGQFLWLCCVEIGVVKLLNVIIFKDLCSVQVGEKHDCLAVLNIAKLDFSLQN